MVTSIDGHLLVDRWTEPTAGIEADMLAEYYDEIAARFHADGWIAGRKSMQYFARGRTRIPGTVEDNLRGVYIGDRKGRDVAVAVDPRGAPALRFAARPVPDRQAHPSVCPFLLAGKSAVTNSSILGYSHC